RFNGVIYKEENVYGDRTIQDYMKDNAQTQLLEAERVKEKIRNFEQDMWNY
ncbi:MAG: gliding motility protein GldN, partial [Flavobacterium stagni]